MRTIIAVTLLALSLAAVTTTQAADEAGAHTQLRANDCIDTLQINESKIVDDRTAIVRTGPKHYLITLKSACPHLRQPPGLLFNSRSRGGAEQGRICGALGETVGRPGCPIESVSKIDKARFSALSDEADRNARGH
jgi:flavin-binding protein dodecin